MEPETQQELPELPPEEGRTASPSSSLEMADGHDGSINGEAPATQWYDDAGLIFMGRDGLRAGWSILIFLVLTILIAGLAGTLAVLLARNVLHLKHGEFTPASALLQEIVLVIGMVVAGTVVALLERRRLLDYNLRGPRPMRHFFDGLVAGFVGLSVLVGGLAAGGWLHFGAVALSGGQIFGYAALWGLCFLLVGLFEEGTFRCYFQFTLTRGINFWWALAIEGCICADLLLRTKGNGVWGVYAVAVLGLVPCLLLELKKTEGAGFWQAAWVTSTVFGFIHTGNNGENWIGIFAAAAIGFVFCVSLWVTGSAWWAIGCHMSWDWAETYFYGTADSGLPAQGHLLTTSPAGNVLWSGGTDGPEGSLLVLGVILLLLVAVLVIYGRRRVSAVAPPVLEQQAV